MYGKLANKALSDSNLSEKMHLLQPYMLYLLVFIKTSIIIIIINYQILLIMWSVMFIFHIITLFLDILTGLIPNCSQTLKYPNDVSLVTL